MLESTLIYNQHSDICIYSMGTDTAAYGTSQDEREVTLYHDIMTAKWNHAGNIEIERNLLNDWCPACNRCQL